MDLRKDKFVPFNIYKTIVLALTVPIVGDKAVPSDKAFARAIVATA